MAIRSCEIVFTAEFNPARCLRQFQHVGIPDELVEQIVSNVLDMIAALLEFT